MHSASASEFSEALAALGGNRALLFTLSTAGQVEVQQVPRDCDVLNVERDLLQHLNEFPFSDQWLADLGEYCAARLKARAEARAHGTVVFPQGAAWEAR